MKTIAHIHLFRYTHSHPSSPARRPSPPEIQRTSLVGAVLYLKSLALPGLDVLRFDFLDPPAQEALEVCWGGGGEVREGGRFSVSCHTHMTT